MVHPLVLLLQTAVALAAVVPAVLDHDAIVNEAKISMRSNPHYMQYKGLEHFANSRFTATEMMDSARTGPEPNIPALEETEAKVFPGSRRKTIRYGPFQLPSVSKKNMESLIFKIDGMADKFTYNAQKPCTDCIIQLISGEIYYADGKVADMDSGVWLHHAALVRLGSGAKDAMCGTPGSDLFFSVGNERSTVVYGIPESKIKTGLHVDPAHPHLLVTEFVNNKKEPQTVWLRVTYEYLDGPHPDYMKSKFFLMTSQLACPGTKKENFGRSNMTVAGVPLAKKFVEHSQAWSSPYNGYFMTTGGHLHDGGEYVDIFYKNNLVCHSVANYAESSSESGKGMAGMKRDGMPSSGLHLVNSTGCGLEMPMKAGDTIRIAAAYDFNKHPGKLNNKGSLDEVMAVAGILLAT